MKQHSTWVYSKYLLCSETKNPWTQVRTWKLELVWRKIKEKSKSSTCKDSENCWDWKLSAQKALIKRLINIQTRLQGSGVLLFMNTFTHDCNPGLEKHFLALQHTDKFPNFPLGLIVIMHIHQLLSTDMLFYFQAVKKTWNAFLHRYLKVLSKRSNVRLLWKALQTHPGWFA